MDSSPYAEEDKDCENFKGVFINPVIHNYNGNTVQYPEGCLSIPELTETVLREPEILISYYDESWNFHQNKAFKGWNSRIIQHEYDHLEGILFTDRLSPLRRRLLKNKLKSISKGKFERKYDFVLT